MQVRLEDLPGKSILVGITDYDTEGRAVSQEQFAGRVERTEPTFILIRLSNGSLRSIPADLSSTRPAPPGTYRLRASGEMIENPDYLSVWNRTFDD